MRWNQRSSWPGLSRPSGAYARWRQAVHRHLPPRLEREISGAARLLDLQQGSAGTRCGERAAAPACMVVAVGRTPGRGRYKIFRLARLCPRHRLARGVGKSDSSAGSRLWDSYDLIEWIAQQRWCDGNVGMVGISGFGAEQLHVARQNPPHLKAIFPFDPRGAYGVMGSFREEYPGGVLHLFRYLIMHFAAMHGTRGKPAPLSPERKRQWQEAINNPDYKMYPHIYNVLPQKGQHMPPYFQLLIDPYDSEAVVEEAEKSLAGIKVPTYTGSGWYAYTYKTHLNGAQN